MPPDEDDLAYLWDIDDACSDIMGFMKETSYMEFEKDKIFGPKMTLLGRHPLG